MVRDKNVDGLTPSLGQYSLTSETVLNLITDWYKWCAGWTRSAAKLMIPAIQPFRVLGCQDSSKPATCGWSDDIFVAAGYAVAPRVVCRTCHIVNSDYFNWQNRKFVVSFRKPCLFTGAVISHALC
jgi:hypothetical protein